MFIIYGIIAISICCIIQFIATFILHFSILDLPFGLFLGIFFASLFVSNKIIKGFIKSNKRKSLSWELICLASGIITFLVLYYVEFKAYVIRENAIDISISSQMYDVAVSNQHIARYSSLFAYILHKLKYVDQFFPIKGGHSISVHTAGFVNYIIFMLQIICSLLGSLVGSYRDKKYYCSTCNKYYQTKKLFLSKREDLQRIMNKDKISIDDIKTLENFMDDHNLSRKNKGNYRGVIMYCADCKKAKLVIKNINYDAKEKKVFMEKYIEVDRSWTEELIRDK